MIFYRTITKVGTAIQGWINENYEKKTPVIPRVYHKYLKDSDKANLYPEVPATDEETPAPDPQVASASAPNTGKVDPDPVTPPANPEDDEDPMA